MTKEIQNSVNSKTLSSPECEDLYHWFTFSSQMFCAFQNANILVLIAGCHCEYPSSHAEGCALNPGSSPPRYLTLCMFLVWFVAFVVRSLEKNDFFNAGITKAQLFLTLHDAVLFALSRKLPESSELCGRIRDLPYRKPSQRQTRLDDGGMGWRWGR